MTSSFTFLKAAHFFFFDPLRGFCSAEFVFSAHSGHARDSMTSTAPSSFRRSTLTARISGLHSAHHTPPQSRAHAVGGSEAQCAQWHPLHPLKAELPTHVAHFEVQEGHQNPLQSSQKNQGSFDSCAQVWHILLKQPCTLEPLNEP
jgi:hypothetical protein